MTNWPGTRTRHRPLPRPVAVIGRRKTLLTLLRSFWPVLGGVCRLCVAPFGLCAKVTCLFILILLSDMKFMLRRLEFFPATIVSTAAHRSALIERKTK